MNGNEGALLLMRLVVSGVYLYAFFRNVRNHAARSWTLMHTGLLFNLDPALAPKPVTKILTTLAMVQMGIGSLMLLLGLEARLGALLLAVFTAGGIFQHHREVARAMLVADRIKPTAPGEVQLDLEELRWSAFAGNFSSGLKNYALVTVLVFFIVAGSGPWSMSDWLGT